MGIQRFLHGCALLLFAIGVFHHPQTVKAEEVQPAPHSQVSAYELIIAMNTLRVAYGLPPLVEDPIINAVAQSTAATMAANNMSWHIGNVRGRIASAGYGNGATVWATENFAVSSSMGIDEIMAVWADPDHMRPAVEPAYCNIGAGTAQTSDGRTYYILQAAYVAGQACGSSSPSTAGTLQPGGSGAIIVPQLIMPVKIATPDAEGRVYHQVQAGQSFWAIAVAYQITIRDLEVWNNITRTTPLQAGQRLYVPGKDTKGYATPTPYGMVALAAPDADGRVIHEVQPYQALITLSDAYDVPVDRILALNGLQADWPLQIGQKILISPGNITPSATLSPIQRLTPETDGKYYHTVQSGETLSWIAGLYGVPLADLMSWNGMNNTSVIRPEQKLLLLVAPPVTPTYTPSPVVATPSPLASATASPTTTPTASETQVPRRSNLSLVLAVTIVLIGGLLWWRLSRKS